MPEPISYQSSVYDYTLDSFIIHSHRHADPIDITENVSVFDIFESLERPYLTGSVIIRDDVEMYDGLKINGTELCEVVLSQPSVDSVPVFLNFIIQYVKGTKKVSDTVEMIDLKLIDKCAFDNNLKQISKSYQGTPTEIITKICRDNLGLAVAPPEVKEVQGPIKIIVPFLKPFEACNMLLNRMSTVDGLPYFLFKTMKEDALQLRSFDELYKKDSWTQQPYVFSNANKASAPHELSPNALFNVENYGAIGTDGIFNLIKTGGVGSHYTVTDMGSGQSESFKHNLEDLYNTLESIGMLAKDEEGDVLTNVYVIDSQPIEQMNSVNNHRLISNNTYNNFANLYEEFDKAALKLDGTRNAIKQLLNKSAMSITVPGFPYMVDGENRSVGTNFDFLYTANNTGQSANPHDLIDKKRSGIFLIYNTRHVFDENDQHRVSLMGVKLGQLK